MGNGIFYAHIKNLLQNSYCILKNYYFNIFQYINIRNRKEGLRMQALFLLYAGFGIAKAVLVFWAIIL